MEELIENVTSQLPPKESASLLNLLLRIIGNVIDHPSEEKYRKLPKAKLAGQLPAIGVQILTSCGFVDQGEHLELPPRSVPSETLTSARDLLDCLIQSLGEGAVQAEGDEDAELAEALRLSMPGSDGPDAKRARASEAPDNDPEGDRAIAEQLEKDEERIEVAFERFRDEDVLVEPDTVEKITKFLLETGEKYVDPQFPPTDKSLFLHPEDGKKWDCLVCKHKSELPPCPPLPSSREEAEKLDAEFVEKVKCQNCGTPAHYVVKVQYFTRPTQWLRPSESCTGCDLLYSHLPGGGKELISRLCPHFLRDKVSNTTVGAPWKLIRGEARPEDVCQGGLGNCWFAGALSVVASCPELVQKLFETREFNPAGAYQIQLHHAGSWRRMVIDDLLPTSQIFEGYTDGTMVYYSRGGELCYLNGARRQLWVPLVEKAAAKIFGCYAGLKGGTFGEALALFTGFPTQRVPLYIRQELRQHRAERRAAIAERRTQMLLQGHEVDDDDSEDDLENVDLQWSKILSASESGYLMGMGCTEEGCEKTKQHIVEDMGLQAPHAYGILEAREVEHEGKLLRMMKIRNPWGEQAPRTWKGDWGKDSPKWTFELKLKLGVVNRSNIQMDDPMSVFWMAFEDVKEYFAAVEICRVHVGWHETRTQVWLPSGVGAGEGVDITVFRKTQVDIATWQERHINREAALNAKGTNIDVGFAVLRKRGLGPDGQPEYDLLQYVFRDRSDEVSEELILEAGYVYRIVPSAFGLSQQYSPRRAFIAVHSVQKVETTKVALQWRDTAWACFEGSRKRGKRMPLQNLAPGVTCYLMNEGAGSIFTAENTSNALAALQVDASDSIGCVSSSGTFDAVVAIPPKSRQVVLATAFALGAVRAGTVVQALGLPSDAAGFALAGEGLHEALPPKPTTPTPKPDEAIIQRAPPEEKEPLKRGLSRDNSMADADLENEEMLKMALELSLAGAGQSTAAEEEDDDLAAALKLSIEGAPSTATPSQSAPQAVAAPASVPETVDVKAQLTARVKVLFQEYVRGGMAPNDAAAKALADAQQGK